MHWGLVYCLLIICVALCFMFWCLSVSLFYVLEGAFLMVSFCFLLIISYNKIKHPSNKKVEIHPCFSEIFYIKKFRTSKNGWVCFVIDMHAHEQILFCFKIYFFFFYNSHKYFVLKKNKQIIIRSFTCVKCVTWIVDRECLFSFSFIFWRKRR